MEVQNPKKDGIGSTVLIIVVAVIVCIVLFFVFSSSKSSSSSSGKKSSPSSSKTPGSSSSPSSSKTPGSNIPLIKSTTPSLTITGFLSTDIITDVKFDSRDNMFVLIIDTSITPFRSIINYYQTQTNGLYLNIPTSAIRISAYCTYMIIDSNDNVFAIEDDSVQNNRIFYYQKQTFLGGSPTPSIITNVDTRDRCISFDSNDSIVVLSKSNSIKIYQKPYSDTPTTVMSTSLNQPIKLVCDKNNNILILTSSDVYKITPQNQTSIINGLVNPFMSLNNTKDELYLMSNDIFYTYDLNGTIKSQFNIVGISGISGPVIKKFERDLYGNLSIVIGGNSDFTTFNIYYYEKDSTNYNLVFINNSTNEGVITPERTLFRFNSRNNMVIPSYTQAGLPSIKYYIAS
jgi:hypothetical protein